MNVAYPAHQRLRTDTAADHASVDRLFGSLSLNKAVGYGRFLTAHARCVLPLERALAARRADAWTPRTPLLLEDLTALGLAAPSPLEPPSMESDASVWGVSYVLEGSRLGGAVLRRGLPTDFPAAYLGAAHPAGHWRAFLGELDAALDDEGAFNEAVGAAKRTFALFVQAAELELAPGRC